MKINKLVIGLYENNEIVFMNTVELPREPIDSVQFKYMMEKMTESTAEYLKEMGMIS